ncbi:uncharacterized protein LOC115788747 [Archocentrus centrarchus]|uniref:uncharacterized protein LOC115788747 n=1 Tax=Archocentrus centrarchus TaxID=63155 RepID=UPI0011EA50D5|nr:uncharacterized protein LOC115788747 [Archocentrus centrarchus]
MRVNIYCCLIAWALSSNVTAGLTRKVFKEKENAILPCPHSVKGKVLWSRESEGRKVDILTADCDGNEKHINDSGRRYSSQADMSLIILKASVSDSGRYLCNNEAAVELTVIPSGTMIHSVEERSNITVKCSHDVGESGVRKWSKDNAEIQQGSIHVSTENQTLIIIAAELADTGLYYCDGKPAAYLNVTKGGRSDRERETQNHTSPPPPPPTKQTTTPQTTAAVESPASASLWHIPVRTVIGLLCLIIMISITVVTWRKALQIQKQKQSAAEAGNDL